MCLIIDTNTIPACFSKDDERHEDFLPVLKWVIEGKGAILYGGTKFKHEISLLRRYVGILGELKKVNKFIEINDVEVDRIQEEVIGKSSSSDFDDPHLVALVIRSGCKIVCTADKRAIPHLKNKDLYPRSNLRPKIYKSASNSDLLTDRNIVDACRPCVELNKSQSGPLFRLVD